MRSAVPLPLSSLDGPVSANSFLLPEYILEINKSTFTEFILKIRIDLNLIHTCGMRKLTREGIKCILDNAKIIGNRNVAQK